MTQPDTKTLARNASVALQTGDRAGLVTAVTALIDARAPLTTGWKSLCDPLIDFGEFELARRAIDLYVTANGGIASARFDQALIYIKAGRPALALSILDRIPRTVPDVAGNAYLRGTIALNLGQSDIARAALMEAVAARPSSGQIWQTLSMLGSLAKDTELADRIIGAEPTMRASALGDQAPYLYALGKTLDDLGMRERAFAAFADGAAIIARQRPHDAAADRQSALSAVRGWTAESIGRMSDAVTVATDRPIVLTGLPRSGSTLAEHIIASHSSVAGGDELGMFGIVAQEIGGTSADALERWVNGHRVDEAARMFLHLIAQRFSGRDRVVDKTLEASRYLGLLSAVVPEAPILWMRRDPLDNAWSAFHTYFLSGVTWSWSLESIAAHFQEEDQLLAQWQDVLGDRLKVVRYEELVTDKQSVIPSMLDHCGLKPEPQVFTPETSERLVTTASVAQVREPINDKAIGSGYRYADQLQPFIRAYGYDLANSGR